MTVVQNLRNFLRNLNFCYSQEMVKLEVRLAKSSSENLERYSSRKRSYNEIMNEFVFLYRTYCLMAVYNSYLQLLSEIERQLETLVSFQGALQGALHFVTKTKKQLN